MLSQVNIFLFVTCVAAAFYLLRVSFAHAEFTLLVLSTLF